MREKLNRKAKDKYRHTNRGRQQGRYASIHKVSLCSRNIELSLDASRTFHPGFRVQQYRLYTLVPLDAFECKSMQCPGLITRHLKEESWMRDGCQPVPALVQ